MNATGKPRPGEPVPQRKPILGVTMGDAAGTGSEIIAKVWGLPEVRDASRLVVIGDAGVMCEAFRITGAPGAVRPISRIEQAAFAPDALDVLDLKNIDRARLPLGQVSVMAGKAAYEYVAKAVELALSKRIDAIVTSALHKEALNKAGYHYAGHTEILAHLTGARSVAMMLVAGNMRVNHVSTHCSMREAIDRVKTGRIVEVIRLTNQAVKRMGIAAPRLAVAGLNPHAGEGGLFGDEEIREIAPAIQVASREGIHIHNRILPADTVFYRLRKSEFDAVVAMYHDQGHIPIKLLGFDSGVNVTLGLPIIRTSVDHGTAFDIAGLGTARPGSLIAALTLANAMCTGRSV